MYRRFSIATKKGLTGLMSASILFFSCCSTNHSGNNHSSNKDIETKKNKVKNNLFEVISPAQQETVYFGESLAVRLKGKKNIPPDSIIAKIGSDIIDIQKDNDFQYQLLLNPKTAGRKNIALTIFSRDTLSEKHHIKIVALPKTSPKTVQYEVIRSFYHDPEAYTQGLLFHNGYLYESTGKPSRSSVRKINPENGEVIRKKDLEPQFFGEGLTLYKDELYMLTYHARKVFVFDLESFKEKRNYNLQTNEGWGLEYNGKDMIVSDGSAYLYFFEPEFFTLENQIEICNNKGLVHSLNELEITPYGLFANIYTKNDIVLIDLDKAIVKGILDLAGLIPEDLPRNADYCLNGIAYNEKTETFYVTGKQWPIMYEIKIVTDY